jgi:preprotein translocase subunit YajC
MNNLSVFLMGAPQGGGGMDVNNVLMLVLIMVVFYVFMILPQMRKGKQQKKFRAEIAKGDPVITIGGVHGKIVEVLDDTFIIEVEGHNRLKIEKSAVSMEATMALKNKK